MGDLELDNYHNLLGYCERIFPDLTRAQFVSEVGQTCRDARRLLARRNKNKGHDGLLCRLSFCQIFCICTFFPYLNPLSPFFCAKHCCLSCHANFFFKVFVLRIFPDLGEFGFRKQLTDIAAETRRTLKKKASKNPGKSTFNNILSRSF